LIGALLKLFSVFDSSAVFFFVPSSFDPVFFFKTRDPRLPDVLIQSFFLAKALFCPAAGPAKRGFSFFSLQPPPQTSPSLFFNCFFARFPRTVPKERLLPPVPLGTPFTPHFLEFPRYFFFLAERFLEATRVLFPPGPIFFCCFGFSFSTLVSPPLQGIQSLPDCPRLIFPSETP